MFPSTQAQLQQAEFNEDAKETRLQKKSSQCRDLLDRESRCLNILRPLGINHGGDITEATVGLRDRAISLENQISSLQDQCNDAKQESATLRSKLAEYNQSQQQKENLQVRFDDLQRRLDGEKSDRARAESELKGRLNRVEVSSRHRPIIPALKLSVVSRANLLFVLFPSTQAELIEAESRESELRDLLQQVRFDTVAFDTRLQQTSSEREDVLDTMENEIEKFLQEFD